MRRTPVTLRSATTAMIFSAAALLTPAVLSAQFTTFVAPPRQAAVDSAKTTVAVTKARADSVARMSLTDMKAWVDSAAGVPGTKVATANDTAMASVATAAPDQRVEPGRTTTTFSNGEYGDSTPRVSRRGIGLTDRRDAAAQTPSASRVDRSLE